MRWKLSLAVPVLLLLFLATDSNAQDVPLTVTIPASNHAITRIEFPDVSPQQFVPDTVRIQYLVGNVGPDPTDGRYRITIRYYVGGSPIPKIQIGSYEAQATCTNGGTEGTIERIACSVVEHGNAVTCSTTYDQMNTPPAKCDGTIACTKCSGGVRVCGARPECY